MKRDGFSGEQIVQNHKAKALELSGVGWSVKESAREDSSPVLSDVNLALSQGDWLAVTGPSGGGKTTLLSLAAGLLKPTVGSVTVLGHQLSKLSEVELSRLRAGSVGMIFQSFHLDDSRDTRDNILLPAYFSQRPWFELRQRAQELASLLQIEDQLEKRVSVLSGGQRQRVAVARALLLNPKLILADEPTGALDRPTGRLVLDLLEKEKAAGASLLTVTHDPTLQERADRVMELEGGRLKERVQTA